MLLRFLSTISWLPTTSRSAGLGSYTQGTRGNIQKSVEKRSMIVRLAKFRMALRFSWANSLHAMSPKEAVMEGLRDPALAFIKGEGHPPRKLQTKTWRLIWCLSEVDRVIDAAIFTEQDKMDTLSYQGG